MVVVAPPVPPAYPDLSAELAAAQARVSASDDTIAALQQQLSDLKQQLAQSDDEKNIAFEQAKRYQAEKKILVKEVKAQRALLATLQPAGGSLGAATVADE